MTQTSKFSFTVFVLMGFLLMTLKSFADAGHEVETEKNIDLNSYIGKWYEIASIPQFFQKQCIKNTTAEYDFAEDGMIKVINSCDTQDGSRSVAEGRARVKDETSNSKLEVTFVKFFGWIFSFGGDYWILKVGDSYEYSIVGHPTRKYAWILSRSPQMTEDQIKRIDAELTRQGYDTCLLNMTLQDSGNDKKVTFCEYVKTLP